MDEKSFKKILDQAIAPLRQDIKELKDVQENRILPPLAEIETTIKSYADSYKINQLNIERVDLRLVNIESELNIDVPEDLKIQHFAD